MNIRPISDLRNKYGEVEKDVRDSGPVFLTDPWWLCRWNNSSTSTGQSKMRSMPQTSKRQRRHNVTRTTKCSPPSERGSPMDETPEPFKLHYLPLFWGDLNDAVSYIANTLGNMAAAEHLIDQVEAKILDYQQNLTVATVYRSSRPRAQTYYWFAVGNYMVFYVVEGNVMEVRRFLFGSRDLTRMPI